MGIILNDTFTDTDGTILHNHTPEVGGWTPDVSVTVYPYIQSNQLILADSAGTIENPLYKVNNSTALSAYFKCAMVQFGLYGFGVAIRRVGTSAYRLDIRMNASGQTEYKITRRYGTIVASGTTGSVVGKDIKFEVVDNTTFVALTFYVDGSPVDGYYDFSPINTGGGDIMIDPGAWNNASTGDIVIDNAIAQVAPFEPEGGPVPPPSSFGGSGGSRGGSGIGSLGYGSGAGGFNRIYDWHRR